jgi:hypothetical protein
MHEFAGRQRHSALGSRLPYPINLNEGKTGVFGCLGKPKIGGEIPDGLGKSW